MKRVVIIGCGIAGLGALRMLQKRGIEYEIFEMESRAGWLCRTENKDGYLFDYTGHLLHFREQIFKDTVFSLIGDKLLQKQRNAWIFSKNVFTRYPFQANLRGLPEDVVVECIYEFGKKHFLPKNKPISNYAEWIDAHFGIGIASHFMTPYNLKLYRRPLEELSPDCGGRFVPKSDLKLLIRGALSENGTGLGYNAAFYYPQTGGTELLIKALVKNENVNYNEKVEQIDLTTRTIRTSKGRVLHFDLIISTQPLNELVGSLKGNIDRIKPLGDKLRYVSILNINIGLKADTSAMHWVYVPEMEYLFHRLGFYHNFSRDMVPQGCGSIYAEISYDSQTGINSEDAVLKCIDDVQRMGILDKKDIATLQVLTIPYGYVIFDQERKKSVKKIKDYLEDAGIYSAGRFGAWEYFSMEDAFMDGWRVAEKVNNRLVNR